MLYGSVDERLEENLELLSRDNVPSQRFSPVIKYTTIFIVCVFSGIALFSSIYPLGPNLHQLKFDVNSESQQITAGSDSVTTTSMPGISSTNPGFQTTVTQQTTVNSALTSISSTGYSGPSDSLSSGVAPFQSDSSDLSSSVSISTGAFGASFKSGGSSEESDKVSDDINNKDLSDSEASTSESSIMDSITTDTSNTDTSTTDTSTFDTSTSEIANPTMKPTRSPDATHSPTHGTRSPDATHSPTVTEEVEGFGSSGKTYAPTPLSYTESTYHPTSTAETSESLDQVVKDTPEPTKKPTRKPTHNPTSNTETPKPTHKPSKAPTDEPSNKPTHKPSHKPSKAPSTDSPTSAPSAGEDESFKYTLNRLGYDPIAYFMDSSSIFEYSILKGFDAIVEPYTSTQLYVLSDDSLSSGSYYSYTMCDADSEVICEVGLKYDESKSSDDKAVMVSCSAYDELQITVTKFDKDGNAIFTNTGSALCIYVRREMRGLSTHDLDNTLEVMYQLWAMGEEEGQAKYGENFHNSTYFSEAHHFNAAWQDGDHIHEGMGFYPQHVKLSNMFEAAMQAVDPSVSLPYWDFTIENEAGTSIFDSSIFQAGTFGTLAAPSNGEYWAYESDSIEDGFIKDGRWAGILSDPNGRYDSRLQNSFGYMRGPWNMNPSPYVARFASEVTSIPGCSAYYQWASGSDFSDFLKTAPYLPHASLHGGIGGVFGCDMFDDLLSAGLIADEDSKVMICTKWGFYLKELYRANYISPNSNCQADSMKMEDISCGFTCNEDTYDDMPSKMKLTMNNAYMPKQMSSEMWTDWRDFVCSGNGFRVFVGDQLESASPSDPSFWPIHPTQERLLHARLMAGGFDDFDWPTDAVNDYVCDKSQCYEYEKGAKDYYDDCCYGHYENDQLLDWVSGDKDGGFGPTNKEILSSTDPSSKDYSASYIYDDFTWSHCTETDFESLFSSLYKSSRERRRL